MHSRRGPLNGFLVAPVVLLLTLGASGSPDPAGDSSVGRSLGSPERQARLEWLPREEAAKPVCAKLDGQRRAGAHKKENGDADAYEGFAPDAPARDLSRIRFLDSPLLARDHFSANKAPPLA